MTRRSQPATHSASRRRAVRLILPLVAVAVAIVAVPASASAAVRTGLVQDPQGDASTLSGPALDLKSIAVRYDDAAGSLRVTWTYYDDVRANYDPSFPPHGDFAASIPVVPNRFDYGTVQWSASQGSGSWSVRTSMQLYGTPGSLSGAGTMSADGQVVTAEFTHPSLVGHDWQRGFGASPPSGGDGFDRFWFDGYSESNVPPVGVSVPITTIPGSGSGSGGAGGNQGMTINDGALYTNDPDVTLSIEAPTGVNSLRVSNDGGFRAARVFPARSTIRWHLAESGPERLPKTVYLRFGIDAQTFTDDIILDQTKPTVSAATVDGASGAARTAAVAQVAGSSSRTFRVHVRARDATSGVAKVQFAARSKRHPSALRKFARLSSYKGKRAPKYVRVQDRAGNFSAWRSVR